MLFQRENFSRENAEEKALVVLLRILLDNQQQQFNNNNNNNNEFPNVHAEKVVDVYVSERVSRAETRAEEKSVGRVVVILIVKEERMC